MFVFNSLAFIGAVLVAGLLCELAAILLKNSQTAKIFVYASVGLNGFGAGLLLVYSFNVLSLLLLAVAGYRIINLLRLVEKRLNERYLQSAVRKTAMRLIGFQTVVIVIWLIWSWEYVSIPLEDIHLTAAAIVTALSFVMLLNTLLRVPKTSIHLAHSLRANELPTVSVLIPARNETHDLTACIETVLANDYPKLEVLVLDDCSHDNTPEVIKQYAHSGVRFIPGEKPKPKWLAKNQAYARLAREATGELLLFMGVDVRLHDKSIHQLVTIMKKRRLGMVSVMPKRGGQRLMGLIVQPMRYWWELALPRQVLKTPPVLSTVWMIEAEALKKAGGMAAVSGSILPESYFARRLRIDNHYLFIRSNADLPIETLKGIPDQIDTAIRTRYPQVKREPFNVLLLSLFESTVLLAPILYLIAGIMSGTFDELWWLALCSSTFYALSHIVVAAVSNPRFWPVSVLSWPFITVFELVLLHISMYRYEFGAVDWKSRNICMPVMQVIPALPPLSKN